MTKAPPPRVQMLLRVWAGKLERGLLDADEVGSITTLLRRLANGERLDSIFGVRRLAQRPPSPERWERLFDMARMRLPTELGGEGLSYGQMVSEAAKRFNKAEDTIIRDYKSRDGKKVRRLVGYGTPSRKLPRKS